MADRSFKRVQALESEVKTLFLDVAIGGTGAPTINYALGTASIVRDSAGVYIITLQDKYNRLLAFNVTQLVAAAEDINFQLEAEAVATSKTIQFRCLTDDVETELSSGSRLLISVDLKNSSVNR